MYKRIIVLLFLICLIINTACKKETKKAEEDRLMEVYEQTPETELMLGLWVTPVAPLMTTAEDANYRYAEIAESGIKMAYTLHDENKDFDMLKRALDAAYKNGIKIMVSLPAGNRKASLETVEKTKDHPAVIGYNMGDEPGSDAFKQFGSLRDKIKETVSEDKIIMCNMLPNYAPEWVYGSYKDIEGTKYQVFLEKYMQIVKPDVLSFDHYPFMASKESDFGRVGLMLSNLSDIRNTGTKYNVDTWGFVQNSSWAGTRIPNEDELRFVCHLHLIFGLKSYSYFLYCQPSASKGAEGIFEGMLTYEGEKTDIYYRVQKQNNDLKAMKGVFLNYDHKGFVVHNLADEHKNSIDEALIMDSYNELKSVKSEGKILTGCFDKEGKTGLYVMNFDYTQKNKATLNLDGKNSFKVWGAGGLEQMGDSAKVIVDLKPGEAKFIEID